MVTCTECGAEIPANEKYLAGYEHETFDIETQLPRLGTHLVFWWACVHEPRENADVRLSSKECVEKFCREHPQYVDAVIEMMSTYQKECSHTVH